VIVSRIATNTLFYLGEYLKTGRGMKRPTQLADEYWNLVDFATQTHDLALFRYMFYNFPPIGHAFFLYEPRLLR